MFLCLNIVHTHQTGPYRHSHGTDTNTQLHCPLHPTPHSLNGVHFYDSICLVEGFGLHSPQGSWKNGGQRNATNAQI